MTHFLISDKKPDGHKLEDILNSLRGDVMKRATKIVDDRRPEAVHVLRNNIRILELLTEAVDLAEDSTAVLTRSFGPNHVGGPPRIGKR